MKRILFLFLFAPLAFSQAVRVDIPLFTAGPNVPMQGGPLPQALWLSNATIQICNHPATLSSCTYTTTYTDATATTPCPGTQQIVNLPGSTCSALAGTLGNIGFWYGGGTVDYIVTSSYGTYGPYTVTGLNGGGNYVSTVTTGTQTMNGPLLWSGTANQIATLNSLESSLPIVNCPTTSTVAACIALLPTGGGVVKLSVGTYQSGIVTPLSTPSIDIEGSGMPWFNSATAPTALTGGTIIQGTVSAIQGANFFTIRNLGIDVGPTYIAGHGGTAEDALSISNSGQVIGAAQVQSPLIENIVALGYSLSAPNHDFLVENVDNARIRNTYGVFNQHGSILKGTNSAWYGDYERGHSIDSFIDKSDPYAPSAMNVYSHFSIQPLATAGDTNGIILSAQDQISSYIEISDGNIGAMSNNGIQIDGGSTSMNNVGISNVTIDYGTTGSTGSCVGLQNQTNHIVVGNLICNNYYQGFGASSSSGNDVSVTNSQFTNIIHEAMVTQGRWQVSNSTFDGIGDHVFYNEAGTLTADNNTYQSVTGTVFQQVGGNFAGLDVGQLSYPNGLFLATHCGPSASNAFNVQNSAGSINLMLLDCSGDLAITGNETMGGTLGVAGAASFGSTVGITGALTVTGGCTGCGSSGIANIQITTGTTLIAANTCTSSTGTTMTGVATTSSFSVTPTTDTSAVTGWGSTGGLSFTFFPTSNTFNWRVCNTTASPITPGGSVTWNIAGH